MINYESADDDLVISFEMEDTEDLIYKKKRIVSSPILTLEQRRQTRLTVLRNESEFVSLRAEKTKSFGNNNVKSKRLDDDYTRKTIFLMIRILFTLPNQLQLPPNAKYTSLATAIEQHIIKETPFAKECVVLQHLIEQQRKVAKEVIFKLSLSNFSSICNLIEDSVGDMYVLLQRDFKIQF